MSKIGINLALAGTIFAAGALLDASAAHATLISIGVSTTSTIPTTAVATDSGSPGIAGYANTVGNWVVNVGAQGYPVLSQPTLNTNTINASTTATGAQTLYVYITEQGLTYPVNPATFLSTLQTNSWTGNIASVQEMTFVSAANALFTGTQIASATFNSQNMTSPVTSTTPATSGAYSETAEFIITTTGGSSSSNDTIDIVSVPEPLSLSLLGVGLVGVGLAKRRRRAA